MHIAAVMAALRVADLDHLAKHALLVVCCRANQHTGLAVVSTSRLGADMGVHRTTASRALDRLVDIGFLNVDKCLGKTSRCQINLSLLGVVPVAQLATGPVAQLATTEDSMDVKKGESRRAAPVGKPVERFVADLPPNPWVYDEETGVAYRADTVRDILDIQDYR